MDNVPDVAASPVTEDAAEPELKRTELRWKIRVAKVDVVQKILISIVGAALVSIFYVFQANQTQSRYYSDLQAQRERADADLRANMFKTLFEAYFKNKIEAAQKAAASGKDTSARAEALLSDLGQGVMLSDLLARNFETVDVRPLFEDLDRRLTDLIERGGKGQKDAFRLREELRRVAYGATARQAELLQANAHATIQQVKITQCQHSPSSRPVITPLSLPPLPAGVTGLINRVGDGSVTLDLAIPIDDPRPFKASAGKPFEAIAPRQVPLSVTYFDMPSLENVRLPDGRRVALTLTRSGSSEACGRFSLQMDETGRKDCDDAIRNLKFSKALGDHGVACSWASLSVILIPSDYISMRDRPYLDELSKRDKTLFDILPKLPQSRQSISGSE
jgi:hypothetical protein